MSTPHAAPLLVARRYLDQMRVSSATCRAR